MIAADTSALAAIILEEDDAARFVEAIADSDTVLVGAPSAFELHLVMSKKVGSLLLPAVTALLSAPKVEIVDWTADHVAIAHDALVRFGGRPSRLNFGDCMAYAVARALDLPLLYKGDDFARTDIRSAL